MTADHGGIQQKSTSQRAPQSIRVVVIGGGSGLSVVLRGLKHHVGEQVADLTAVVTVSDDGGSSGRLRRDLGVLPPGDIRNCIVALADDEALLSRLFQYRFPGDGGLGGHSFGNLLLTALAGVTGDFAHAIATAESILSVRGHILPATLEQVHLRGLGRSGKSYVGESAVGASAEPLVEVTLEPANTAAYRPAVEAILAADLVVLGPGSLYTSVLANLLIPGICAAVNATAAKVVLPLNLMTQPGETDGLDGDHHLRAVAETLAPGVLDAVLVADHQPTEEQLQAYTALGAMPVTVDQAVATHFGASVLPRDLLDDGVLIRHHPDKLGRALIELASL